jgi:ABC-type multidrug transport system ATPase subunit
MLSSPDYCVTTSGEISKNCNGSEPEALSSNGNESFSRINATGLQSELGVDDNKQDNNYNFAINTNADQSAIRKETKVTPPLAVAAAEEGATDHSAMQMHEDEPTTSATSRSASGWRQFFALTEKNFVLKGRSKVSTFFEILTPVALVALLVAGYVVSPVVTTDSKIYANLTFDLPGDILPLLLTGTVSNIQEPTLNNITESGNNASTGFGSGIRNIFEPLDDILTHPIPIPTLDQYVALAATIQRSMGNVTSSMLNDILENSNYGRSLQNLLDLGTLHLCPRGPVLDSFVSYINETYPSVMGRQSLLPNLTSSLRIKTHDSADKAVRYINDNVNEPTWALVDLTNSFPSASLTKSDLDNVSFTLRMNYTTIPNTSFKVNPYKPGLNPEYQKYYLSGFLTLQRTLQEFAFAQAVSVLSSEYPSLNSTCQLPRTLQIMSMPFPTLEYSLNQFFLTAGFLMGLVASMGFLYPMSRLVKLLVEEKELRLRETLYILGVKSWAYWLSWVMVSYVIFLGASLLISLLLHGSVISHSSLGYLFALFALFSSSIIGFSFFIAAFFSKAKLAAIMAPIGLFATNLPYWIFYSTNPYEKSIGKIFASLCPCTAFSFGANILAAFEGVDIGVHAHNASEGSYSFNTCLIMLSVDTALFFFLGWYLERVLPSSYGVRRPLYFFLLPSYWGLQPSKVWYHLDDERNSVRGEEDCNFEVPGQEFGSPKVIISDLVKRYKNSDANAVDHLSLNLYENQITSLLGHNGAGKTSAISVMTGLLPPTSGQCLIYGNPSISTKGLEKARESMGICPQHDVLFTDLTVAEHLTLFEKIKGNRPTSHSIQKQANNVGIGDKLNTLAGQLSGGMKRKLSIAIAMCGNPKFLLLDEPTTGMDPFARRATWEMLRKAKENRVILLTTHFMDEAEVLSDRIAVMKTGKLQCVGSPLFLKRRFGLGYTLTVILSESLHSSLFNSPNEDAKSASYPLSSSTNTPDDDFSNVPALTDSQGGQPLQEDKTEPHTLEVKSESDQKSDDIINLENGFGLPKRSARAQVDSHIRTILGFLQRFIPATKVVRRSGREVKFRFPNGFEHTFPSMFDAFEEGGMRERLSIGGYSVTNSSLEEVFLRLAEAPCNALEESNAVTDAANVNLSQAFNSRNNSVEDYDKSLSHQRNDHHLLPFAQVGVLLKKRWVVQRRDFKGFIFMIVLPAIVIALVLLTLTFNPPLAGPPLDLSLNLFESSLLIGDETLNQTSPTKLESYLGTKFPLVEVYRLLNVTSSYDVSSFLLQNGGRSLSPRMGSYIEDDRINVNLNVDWDEIWKMLNKTSQGSSSMLSGISALIGMNASDIQSAQLLSDIIPSILNERNPFLKGNDKFLLHLNTSVSILHNTSSPHGVAVLNNEYANYLYKQCTSGSFSLVNHPLPISTEKSIEIRSILSVMSSLFLLIPLCFVPSAFIVFLVKEKSCKSKHVQLVSGVNLSSFWIAHFVWDLAMYTILAALIMIIFAAYGSTAAEVFVGDVSSFFATTLLIFGYGFSALPFAYIITRPFDNHSSAQLATLGVFFLTGFMAVTALFILSAVESTKHIASSLRRFFRIFPAYNVGDGLISLGTSYYERELFGQDASPFDWDVTGIPIFLLFMLTIPYFVLLLGLEYSDDGGSGGFVGRLLRRIREKRNDLILKRNGVHKSADGELLLSDGLNCSTEEDEDVILEKNRVIRNELALKSSAKILLVNLWKVYPPSVSKVWREFRQCIKWVFCCYCLRNRVENREIDPSTLPKRAVRGLTLAIEEGETFGLLGVNGAGKTTTMAILTGDIPATAGKVVRL